MKKILFLFFVLSAFYCSAQIENKQEKKLINGGTYTNPTVTVNAQGKVTAITNGSGGGSTTYGEFANDALADPTTPKNGTYIMKRRNRLGIFGGSHVDCKTCN